VVYGYVVGGCPSGFRASGDKPITQGYQGWKPMILYALVPSRWMDNSALLEAYPAISLDTPKANVE
jgi:hypothetical protein